MSSTLGICRVCQRKAMHRSTLCHHCFVKLYPEAAIRQTETRHARSMDQLNEAYDTARQTDERDAPVKRERWER